MSKETDPITEAFGPDPLFNDDEQKDEQIESIPKKQPKKKTKVSPEMDSKPAQQPAQEGKVGGFQKVDIEKLKQVVIVYSEEGAGKTHWSMASSPSPHYTIDTEGGHNLLTAAKVDPDQLAVTIRDQSGEKPSQQWFSPAFGLWIQLENAVDILLGDDVEPGTVNLDSASDILAMAVAEMNIEWERGEKAFPPMMYGQVYGLISTVIHNLRSKHHVVMTARVKDEYLNNERTGRLKLDLWRNGIYLADHVIRINLTDNLEREYVVEKGPLMGIITRNPDGVAWKDLLTGNRKPYEKETQKIKSEKESRLLVETAKKAWKALTDKGIDFEKKDVSEMSPEEAHEYIQSLRELFKQNN
jgi:hypothetical protein